MNVPATMAALTGEKVRWRFAELATEALMVVFAVLVALGVEEWREERQLREFADRVRAAVDLEIRQNLDEFRSAGPDLIAGRDDLGSTLQKLRAAQEMSDRDEERSVNSSFSVDFPDISTAAWRVAQSSQAAPYFDYAWVIERARQYDGFETYLDIRDQVLDAMSALFMGEMEFTGERGLDQAVVALQRLYGRLEILVQLHEGLQEDMEAYLGETETEQETEAERESAP